MKSKYLILFSLSGLIIALDQFTKIWTHVYLKLGETKDLISGFLTLIHSRNAEFAFGLLKTPPSAIQSVFFVAIPVFALILIVLIFIKLRDDQMLTSVALTTILAGALGNLIDRVQYGYVVDPIQVHFGEASPIPAFNLADISIIVGVVIMFFNTWFQHRRTASKGGPLGV